MKSILQSKAALLGFCCLAAAFIVSSIGAPKDLSRASDELFNDRLISCVTAMQENKPFSAVSFACENITLESAEDIEMLESVDPDKAAETQSAFILVEQLYEKYKKEQSS